MHELLLNTLNIYEGLKPDREGQAGKMSSANTARNLFSSGYLLDRAGYNHTGSDLYWAFFSSFQVDEFHIAILNGFIKANN